MIPFLITIRLPNRNPSITLKLLLIRAPQYRPSRAESFIERRNSPLPLSDNAAPYFSSLTLMCETGRELKDIKELVPLSDGSSTQPGGVFELTCVEPQRTPGRS